MAGWQTITQADMHKQFFCDPAIANPLFADLLQMLERYMLLFLPMVPLGIQFVSFQEVNMGITVRTHCRQHDSSSFKYDMGHGYCSVCCAYLPQYYHCPCGLHCHDHAVSFCVRPFEPSAPAKRVCLQCAPKLLGTKVLRIDSTGGTLGFYSLAGSTLWQEILFWRLSQGIGQAPSSS